MSDVKKLVGVIPLLLQLFIVEVKTNAKGLSQELYRFQKETGAPHAFQVAFDLPFVNKNCFEEKGPILVPARTFLAQLV